MVDENLLYQSLDQQVKKTKLLDLNLDLMISRVTTHCSGSTSVIGGIFCNVYPGKTAISRILHFSSALHTQSKHPARKTGAMGLRFPAQGNNSQAPRALGIEPETLRLPSRCSNPWPAAVA